MFVGYHPEHATKTLSVPGRRDPVQIDEELVDLVDRINRGDIQAQTVGCCQGDDLRLGYLELDLSQAAGELIMACLENEPDLLWSGVWSEASSTWTYSHRLRIDFRHEDLPKIKQSLA